MGQSGGSGLASHKEIRRSSPTDLSTRDAFNSPLPPPKVLITHPTNLLTNFPKDNRRGPRRGVLMYHVDFKKYVCRPVEFKKCSCRPVEFKKLPCPMSLSLQISCCMSLRPKRLHVALSILGVEGHTKGQSTSMMISLTVAYYSLWRILFIVSNKYIGSFCSLYMFGRFIHH